MTPLQNDHNTKLGEELVVRLIHRFRRFQIHTFKRVEWRNLRNLWIVSPRLSDGDTTTASRRAFLLDLRAESLLLLS
ncbi:MAG: hypothetical protein ACR2HX_00095 [Pyrinomonadaceae bacterium]